TLATEQRTGRAFEGEQGLVGVNTVAILHLPMHGYTRVERTENRIHPRRAADNRLFTRDHPGTGQTLGRNQLGGDVSAADVFSQGATDIGFDFAAEFGESQVGHGRLRFRRGAIIEPGEVRAMLWPGPACELLITDGHFSSGATLLSGESALTTGAALSVCWR